MSIGRQILKINPNAKFSINAEDVNQITWLEGTTPISISDIEAQAGAVELEKALENLRVKELEKFNSNIFMRIMFKE